MRTDIKGNGHGSYFPVKSQNINIWSVILLLFVVIKANLLVSSNMKTTKELARELGLLRKRSSANQHDKNVKKIRRTNQVFKYVIVIDFESTCWDNSKYRTQEIIEFPAVLLNTSSGEIESEFREYVYPQENTTLSEFCTKLTGISQEQVENGIPLSMCLSRFSNWLAKLGREKNIVYNTASEVQASNLCTFITWSDWDLGVCLMYEARRKQLRKPAALSSWIDLRATYKRFYERKPNGLNGALQDVGIEFEGREHSGLDDARNTARLAWRMMCDGCIMTITKSLDAGSTACNQHRVDCIKAVAQTITAPNTKAHNKQDHKSTAQTTLPAKILSCQVQRSASASFITGAKPSFTIYQDSSTTDGCTTKSIGVQITSKSVGSKAQDLHHQGGLNSGSNIMTNKRVLTTPKTIEGKTAPLQPNKQFFKQNCLSTNVFKTPSVITSNPGQIGAAYTFPLVKKPGIYNSSTKYGTGSMMSAMQIPTSMKATPPMCRCGKRAKRHVAQTPGPNMGRTFFTCPQGRRSMDSSAKSGCSFFKWETSTVSSQPRLGSAANVLKCYSGNVVRNGIGRGKTFPLLPQPQFDTPLNPSKPSLNLKKSLGIPIKKCFE